MHKVTQAGFQQTKVVPPPPDLLSFRPPRLEIGVLHTAADSFPLLQHLTPATHHQGAVPRPPLPSVPTASPSELPWSAGLPDFPNLKVVPSPLLQHLALAAHLQGAVPRPPLPAAPPCTTV